MTAARRCLPLLAALVACAPVPLPENGPYHAADASVSVTRLVHASTILELGATRLYVDPWLYSGVFVRQTEPLGLRPHALPAADAVLLTAGAGERFDRRTLRQLAPRVPVAIAPPPLAPRLAGLGFREVRALAPWSETRVGDVAITAVPGSPPDTTGYVLSHPEARVYVAGPGRLSPALADIATAFPDVDVALLPIGGRRLFGVRREMDPEEAVAAARTLRPKRLVPVGYGRGGAEPFVWHARRPLERLRRAARAAGLPGRAIVALAPGESWHYVADP